MVQSVLNEFQRRLQRNICLAGGCVRDHLMKRTPKDFDLFILGFDAKDDKEKIKAAVADLPIIKPLTWHNYEPYLITTVRWSGVQVQLIGHPAASMADLVDTFDWNVCRFGFNGAETLACESIDEIAPGKQLKLHRVSFAMSTLRRGFRFSERFKMQISRDDITRLCQMVVDKETKKEPDMPALAAAHDVS